MPSPGRSHISPKTKFKMPAPEYGLSRIGTYGRQLTSLNDCSPVSSRSSGSLGVTKGSSGSGGGTVCPRSRWMRSHCSSTAMLKRDAFGQPLYTARSEEHTSELQSHSDLVCRLLLEKKKKKKYSVFFLKTKKKKKKTK